MAEHKLVVSTLLLGFCITIGAVLIIRNSAQEKLDALHAANERIVSPSELKNLPSCEKNFLSDFAAGGRVINGQALHIAKEYCANASKSAKQQRALSN